jgi:hypothetical protein
MPKAKTNLRSLCSQIAASLLLLSATQLTWARGGFVVLPPIVQSPELRAEVRELHGSGMLQSMAEAVNAIFIIPEQVGMRFSECGEANAYFSADDMEISMCIELLEDIDESLSDSYPDEDDRADITAGAFTAIVLHEVGHALVSVLDIPITGREEDAVDQLSAWVLIESDMADAVLSAAETYYVAEDGDDDETFADEHSLNKQRYFNMVCWVYGSDPDAHQDLLEEWELPEARAEQCEAEYETLRNSWSKLLANHLRE